MKNLFIINAILTAVTMGCTSKPDEFPVITIDPIVAEQDARLSDFVSDLEVVRLETIDSSLFGMNNKLAYMDDDRMIFLVDRSRVLMFDGSGKFLRQIGSRGGGPAEFLSVLDVEVDPEQKRIYVFGSPVQVYDFDGGHIARYDVRDTPGMQIHKMGDGFLIAARQSFNDTDRDFAYFVDSSFNLVKTFKSRYMDAVPEPRQMVTQSPSKPYQIDDKIFHREPCNDTTYEVTREGITPVFAVTAGKYGFTIEEIVDQNLYGSVFRERIAPSIRDAGKVLFVFYVFEEQIHCAVYEKENGDLIFRKKFAFRRGEPNLYGLPNDLMEGAPDFWPEYMADDLIVSMVDPAVMSPEQQTAYGVDDESNPVLFVGRLK